jgi:hypothetical protein
MEEGKAKHAALPFRLVTVDAGAVCKDGTQLVVYHDIIASCGNKVADVYATYASRASQKANADFVVTACNSHYEMAHSLDFCRALLRGVQVGGRLDPVQLEAGLRLAREALLLAGGAAAQPPPEGMEDRLAGALEDLMGDRMPVQGGVCQWCGRDYKGEIGEGFCPSDDCPHARALDALVAARGNA